MAADLRREVMHRLGHPRMRERCAHCSNPVEKTQWAWDWSKVEVPLTSNAIRVCLPCVDLLKRSNVQFVRNRERRRRELEVANEEYFRSARCPSSRAYLQACADLAAELLFDPDWKL
jgi:hypothetical protein